MNPTVETIEEVGAEEEGVTAAREAVCERIEKMNLGKTPTDVLCNLSNVADDSNAKCSGISTDDAKGRVLVRALNTYGIAAAAEYLGRDIRTQEGMLLVSAQGYPLPEKAVAA